MKKMAFGARFQKLRGWGGGGPYYQGGLNSQRGSWELNSQRVLDSVELLCFSANVLFCGNIVINY